MLLYNERDRVRLNPEVETISDLPAEPYRTPWRRDSARLVHSPSYRRLQGKTQLFPADENDFFRNRLTHSIEVAQIAKSIAIRINDRNPFPGNIKIDTDLVEFAALAHDLGHPPFGHIGEKALDELMIANGGFEGNAQTFRILTKLEKKFLLKDENDNYRLYGLNLTSRSLASVLKYDKKIPFNRKPKFEKDLSSIEPVKGYYYFDQKHINTIKKNILNGKKADKKFKTIECQIMDIADDIAYSTYDLEDSFKAGFLNIFDILYANDKLILKVTDKVNKALVKHFKIKYKLTIHDIRNQIMDIFEKIFEFKVSKKEIEELLKPGNVMESFKYFTGVAYNTSKQITEISPFRIAFTSKLVGQFIRGIEFVLDKKIPALSVAYLNLENRLKLEVLKQFIFESQVHSSKIKMTAIRGKEIIYEIYDQLMEKDGHELMPNDYKELYELSNKKEKGRFICDFIAGMTNRYAIEFYGRLKSEDPETIFKPF